MPRGYAPHREEVVSHSGNGPPEAGPEVAVTKADDEEGGARRVADLGEGGESIAGRSSSIFRSRPGRQGGDRSTNGFGCGFMCRLRQPHALEVGGSPDGSV